MEYQTVYCQGCDRDVRVYRSDSGHDDAQANVHDPELICLEVGTSCTGSMCPLGAAEPNAMVGRLIRSGLSLDRFTLESGFCAACGLESELAAYGHGLLACTVCGTSWRASDGRTRTDLHGGD